MSKTTDWVIDDMGLTKKCDNGNLLKMNTYKDSIRNIHRRQIARLLDHLKRTNQLTVCLEKDIKRSFGFVFKDVEQAIQQGNDEEENENTRKRDQ